MATGVLDWAGAEGVSGAGTKNIACRYMVVEPMFVAAMFAGVSVEPDRVKVARVPEVFPSVAQMIPFESACAPTKYHDAVEVDAMSVKTPVLETE